MHLANGNRCWLVALLLVVVAGPQAAGAQTVRPGVKGGLNFATVPQLVDLFEREGAVGLRGRYGVVVGGFATVRLTDWIAFQPEALYAQKGMHGREPTFGDDWEVRLDYVDVPLLVRLHPRGDRGVAVVVGPSLNFNVKAGTKFADERYDEDIRDDVEPFEVAVVVGVGWHVAHFVVEGRFSQGLTNIFKEPFGNSETYRNRSFAVMAGVRF